MSAETPTSLTAKTRVNYRSEDSHDATAQPEFTLSQDLLDRIHAIMTSIDDDDPPPSAHPKKEDSTRESLDNEPEIEGEESQEEYSPPSSIASSPFSSPRMGNKDLLEEETTKRIDSSVDTLGSTVAPTNSQPPPMGTWFNDQQLPLPEIAADLKSRITDWMGHPYPLLGDLYAADSLIVGRVNKPCLRGVCLFQVAIGFFTQSKSPAKITNFSLPSSTTAPRELKLKGRIYLHHITRVYESSTDDKLRLSLEVMDVDLDHLMIVFPKREMLERWQTAIKDRIAAIRSGEEPISAATVELLRRNSIGSMISYASTIKGQIIAVDTANGTQQVYKQRNKDED